MKRTYSRKRMSVQHDLSHSSDENSDSLPAVSKRAKPSTKHDEPTKGSSPQNGRAKHEATVTPNATLPTVTASRVATIIADTPTISKMTHPSIQRVSTPGNFTATFTAAPMTPSSPLTELEDSPERKPRASAVTSDFNPGNSPVGKVLLPGPSVSRTSNAGRGSGTPTTPRRPAPGRSSTMPLASKVIADPFSMLDFGSHLKSSGKSVVASHSRRGVIGRMLGRSKTDSSFNKEPSPQPMTENPPITSGPTLSRSESTSTSVGTPHKEHSQEDDSQSPSPSRPSLKTYARTYGGSSRSFLVSLPTTSAAASRLLQDGTGEIDIDTYNALTSQSQIHSQLDALDADADRESYSALRARLGVDPSSDDPHFADYPEEDQSPDPSPSKGKGKAKMLEALPRPAPLPPGMMNDLKSITELRSKGESRRFLDDLGYLFEGLNESASVGVRRGSALEIVTKLCDLDFARKAKSVDLFHKTWEDLRQAGAGEGDKILDIILVLFCALVARDDDDLVDLAERTDFGEKLLVLLRKYDRSRDVLFMLASGASDVELKRAGVLRTEKVQLNNILNLFKKRSELIFINDQIRISTSLVRVLSKLPPRLLTKSNFPGLFDHLLSELRLVPPRLEAYASGLPLLPASSDNASELPFFEDIEHSLRLLDSYLLGNWDEGCENSQEDVFDLGDKPSTTALISGLVALPLVSLVLCNDPVSNYHETAQDCLDFAFRVLVNLSHNSPEWCWAIISEEHAMTMVLRPIITYQAITSDKNKEAEKEHDTRPFDQLCLGLALLTNLVQGADDVKDRVRETVLDPACPAKPACIRGPCRCHDTAGALKGLVSVFLTHSRMDDDDPSADFIRGHLTVLFGLLMRDSPKNRVEILSYLPGMTVHSKLNRLIDEAEQFCSIFDTLASSTSRPQATTLTQDQDGVNSARDALAYLKQLSKEC